MTVFHYQNSINLGGGGGGAGSLQAAYNLSFPADITLNAANGTLTVIDNAVSLGDLLVVQDNTTTDVFKVEATGDTTATGILLGSNLKRGTGDPNGVVSGTRGDIFERTDGSSGDDVLYVCQGGVVWSALVTAGSTVTFINDIIPIGGVVLPGSPLGSLSVVPTQVASLQLDINGNTQVRTVDYTIVGSAITWTGAFAVVPSDAVVAYYV
jgi:hypothetical protein